MNSWLKRLLVSKGKCHIYRDRIWRGSYFGAIISEFEIIFLFRVLYGFLLKCHISRSHFSKILPRWRNGAQMGKKLLVVGFLEEPIGLFVDNMENRI